MRNISKLSHSLAQTPRLGFGWNAYLQRPGDSEVRKVTCIPGNYIGPEITGIIIINKNKKYFLRKRKKNIFFTFLSR